MNPRRSGKGESASWFELGLKGLKRGKVDYMNTEGKKNQNAQTGSLRRVLEFSSLIPRKCQGKGCCIPVLPLVRFPREYRFSSLAYCPWEKEDLYVGMLPWGPAWAVLWHCAGQGGQQCERI